MDSTRTSDTATSLTSRRSTQNEESMSKRLAMFDTMIAKGSVDPFVHYARAMELRSLERTTEALEAFSGVATQFPAYVPTYLMGAQTAELLGRGADARSFLERG